MCGEKRESTRKTKYGLGSPPHVRGKVPPPDNAPRLAGDHPRMCGEKWLIEHYSDDKDRITPACAGKRVQRGTGVKPLWDHPRMCGEKSPTGYRGETPVGSPPHVRGKACFTTRPRTTRRITPACAGKRLKRSRSTVPPVAIVPLFPSVCNKPVVSDGSPAGRDAPLFLPAENAVPASPAYNLRSL